MKPGIDYPGAVVVFFCHNGRGQYVFHKRSANTRSHWHMWDNGGGGVEYGETLEEALFREMKEEYGCGGSIERVLEPNTLLVEEHGIHYHWIVHPFILRVNPDEVIMGEPEKQEAIGWFSLDQLPSPLHPGVIKDLKQYRADLEQYSSPLTKNLL